MRARLPLAMLAIALFALWLGAIGPRAAAGNAPIVIDSPNDVSHVEGCVPNDCTLPDAIHAANQQAGPDTITFGPNLGTFEIFGQLPFVDGSQGITIEGGDHIIASHTPGQVAFGLVVDSDIGATIHDVTINGLILDDFGYDGLQVCAGVDTQSGTCISEVSGVTMNDVRAFDNAHSGVRILGGRVDNVTLQDINSASNGENGLTIGSSEDLFGIQLTNLDINTNGAAGVDISGNPASDISISGGQVSNNGGDGYLFSADDLSGLSFDTVAATNNDRSSVKIAVTGSLSNLSVVGSTFGSHLGGFRAQAGSIFDGTITGNTIGPALGVALNLTASNTFDDMTIENNTINHNGGAGVEISAQTGAGTIIRGNTLNNNTTGVELSGAHDASSLQATISRNSILGSIYLGINLNGNNDANDVTLNDDGDADVGPNGLLNYPVISSADAQSVSGTACANCLVELFVADPDPTGYGEGKTFIADATAEGGGDFAVPICGLTLSAGDKVTATATDPQGNTSEFSLNFTTTVSAGDCVTITHLQGDLTCNNHIDGLDALRALDFDAGIAQPVGGTCPAVGSGTPKFGDANCDGAIDQADALAVLAFAAGASPRPQNEPCTNLGAIL